MLRPEYILRRSQQSCGSARTGYRRYNQYGKADGEN